MNTSLIYGIGINDLDYPVYLKIKNNRRAIAEYATWKSMFVRCYSKNSLEKNPTYIGCAVSKEWHLASSFAKWFLAQDHKGKQLDKDILIPGNKIYSPKTCILVSPQLNMFLTDRKNDRGDHMIGACWHKLKNKFESHCNNPFTKKFEYLGSFISEIEAHHAWKRRKHELALIYADMQTDQRITQALKNRFF